MDMKVPETYPEATIEGATGVYYVVLYGIISFLLVLVVLLLFYVACSKRYRLNWFERNLLETAETRELAASHEALISVDTDRRASRQLLNDDKFWVPIGKTAANCDVLASSDDESETVGSPGTSKGSKASLAVDSVRNSGDEAGASGVVAIARNDKHVVLTAAMPVKPLVSMNTRLDLSKIDTALYEQPVSPVLEVMQEKRGQVHLTLAYDSAAGMLSVRLIEAQSLMPRDFNAGSADPYAKIRLLPDRSNVWQTRIHKKTLNPVFDEDFVFEVRALAFSRRTLEIILYDFDAYARHVSMGGVKLPLSEVDLTEKLTIWRNLIPCSDTDDKSELGDLLVSLSFLPSAERLTVVVMKARNLRIVDDTRVASDPFVKVTLYHGGKRLKKKKTSIHRNTVNPTFNERLTFDVGKDILIKCSLEMCVYHDTKLGQGELLGRTVVGGSSSCKPEDRDFFHELLSNKSANAKWLALNDPRL